ncbi:jg22665, partial [Pararge aegeria aegeria]
TLSHCELITDFGIKQLSMSPCAAEHLTVLGLDNCPLVTDGALEHLISCHNLQLIELYDCQMVTRNAIRKLRVR